MVNKIPQTNVVKGPKRVLPAGHPLLSLYDPSSVIIVGEVGDYENIAKTFPGSANLIGGGINPGDSVIGPTGATGPTGPTGPIQKPDVPELSDIEDVQQYKYYDEVTKALKIKVVMKIRNSSQNPEKVAGVDARIEP